jgi:oxygen-independent coproporphyrinogen III oxidase
MQPHLLKYALQDIPRYTSYPTAAQFGPLGPESFEGWRAGIGAQASLSAYIHVPFCRQLCWYCGCHTSVPNSYSRAERFTNAITREIAATGAALPGPKGRVKHLHFGGGTPTYLKPREFTRIMEAVHSHLGLAPGAELAVESDPRTLTPEIRECLAENGINRASLGVQDFSLAVQAKINRIQPFGLVSAGVEGLRKAGIEAINFDLIYGLPGQTESSVAETARLTAKLSPSRVAVFGYAHVPWFKKQQTMIKDADLPGVEARFAQATIIGEVLQEHGYVPVGLDHYVRPDDDMATALANRTLRRNFQGYTTDAADALLGFGPSSISAMPGGFAQNARDQAAWITAAEAGATSVDRGIAVTAEDMHRAEIISQIMCYLEADFAAFPDALPRLEELASDGLVKLSGTRLTVPAEHRLFCRTVAQAFDAHYTGQAGRHAKAV